MVLYKETLNNCSFIIMQTNNKRFPFGLIEILFLGLVIIIVLVVTSS
ncbi:unnamed protein product [Brassica rapa subsp. narinosa]